VIPFRFSHRHFLTSALISVVVLGIELPQPMRAIADALAPSETPQTSIAAPHSDTVQLRRGSFAGPFEADLLRVVDGDTIEARVRIWFGQDITTLVRLRGIDATELHARCAEEARGANAARDYLITIAQQKTLVLRDVDLDKYGGRILASVSLSDGSTMTDVSATMLANGLARPYQGGKRGSWCQS